MLSRIAKVVSLLMVVLPSVALSQAQPETFTPCDDPQYRELLLRELESLTYAERSYLAQANFACADYLRAVQVVRLYVEDRPPARFYKDPQLAQVIAVPVPGGGHIYSGEPAVGVALLLGTVTAATAGLLLSECHRGADHCEPVPLGVGLSAAAVFWALGIADAPASAHRINAARRR